MHQKYTFLPSSMCSKEDTRQGIKTHKKGVGDLKPEHQMKIFNMWTKKFFFNQNVSSEKTNLVQRGLNRWLIVFLY